MKNKATTSPTAATPAVPALVIPPAFQSHTPGMSDVALAFAIELGEKHPTIVAAGVEFKDAYGRAGEKFYGFASALRAAKLLKKEATTLLLGLGLSKSRASEVIKVSSVSDELWAKYSAQSIGFKATLKLANGTPEGEDSGGDGASSDGGTKPAKPVKPALKIHDVSHAVKKALVEAAIVFSNNRPLKKGEKTEYAYAHVVDGVSYYFAVTASPKNAGK